MQNIIIPIQRNNDLFQFKNLNNTDITFDSLETLPLSSIIFIEGIKFNCAVRVTTEDYDEIYLIHGEFEKPGGDFIFTHTVETQY